jgi:hypothetical protein
MPMSADEAGMSAGSSAATTPGQIASLRDRTWVVTPDVFDQQWLVRLHAGLESIARVKPLKSHQPYLPLTAPLTDTSVVANPAAFAHVHAMLGELVVGPLGMHRQAGGARDMWVHRDRPQLFSDIKMPRSAYSLVVQIELTDFTDANGATEVWPPSHLLVDASAGGSGSRHRNERQPRHPSR